MVHSLLLLSTTDILSTPDILSTNATNATNPIEAAGERVSTVAHGTDAMQGLPLQQLRAGASEPRQVLRRSQVALRQRPHLPLPHLGRRRPRQAHVGTREWRKHPSSGGYL